MHTCARTHTSSCYARIGKEQGLSYYQLDEGGIHSVDGKETYFLGIIDTLTKYGLIKRGEQTAKVFQGKGVSVRVLFTVENLY